MGVYMYLLILLNIALCRSDISTNFQICKRSDPNLNGCLKTAIQNALSILQNGLPEYNVPPIEPVNISNYTVKALPPLTFDQKYANVKIYNSTSIQIKEVNAVIDDAKFTLDITAFTHKLLIITDYDYENAVVDGTDMSSKGKLKLTYDEMNLLVNMTGTLKGSNNVNYAMITDFQLKTLIDDYITKYETSNAEISKTLTAYINDNWEYLYSKEKRGYAEMFAYGYKNYANSLISLIPYDKLFPK